MKRWHDQHIFKRELYNSRMHLFLGKLRLRWPRLFKVAEVLVNGVVEVENYKGERFKAEVTH